MRKPTSEENEELKRFRELEHKLDELAEEMDKKITEFTELLIEEPLTYEKAIVLLRSFRWRCLKGSSKDFAVDQVEAFIRSRAMQREMTREKKELDENENTFGGRKITISMKNGTWEWSRRGFGFKKRTL
ncbi:hypothetical protein I6N96_03350 [Enterococcus sp. BWM-S5]|uniref:Uncharacterized protein n=1 Tax=Enterococcus larvae TaxID=2794352 RepID=A0ABS4CF81_9ENTE|nr:hypothetical protein [Enterococcus larvae]MBP1045299.1 hypothetical protein [Enterococcus larvae]